MEQYSDELYHYGRKGMKWYQNIFTTPQARRAAKKRRQALEKARDTKAAKKQEAEERERIIRSGSAKELQKNKHRLSDDELQRAINRINMEQKLSEVNKAQTTKGKKIFTDILENSAKNIGQQAVTYIMGRAVNKTLGDLMGDSSMVNPKKGQKDK